MILAARALGAHRRDWAYAMQAEFEIAMEDGRPLAFATGCLIAAWREMPRHAEGRFALTNHAIAIGMILPMAALLLSAALLGFPFIAFANPGAFGFPSGKGAHMLLLNAGNMAVAPSLTLLILLLAVSHARVAWLLLEENWEGAMAFGRLGAAATTTLIIFTTFSLHPSYAVLPIAFLAVQTLAVLALARWHGRLRDDMPFEAPG
jgi:hypothetical protein